MHVKQKSMQLVENHSWRHYNVGPPNPDYRSVHRTQEAPTKHAEPCVATCESGVTHQSFLHLWNVVRYSRLAGSERVHGPERTSEVC